MYVLVFLALIVAESYGQPGFGSGEEDWGYVTVRPEAHMFWWLYETTAKVTNVTERPLVVWLQGGPGASSTGIGNFLELGPLDVDLNPRNHTWIKQVNLLFIDNPVGTGYSYVDNSSKLTTTNEQISKDLITCLNGFYVRHPEFQRVPLYVASQSYGGKMTAGFVLELYKKMKTEAIKLHLKGIMLIAPAISPPESALHWAPYLYNFGAIDKEGYAIVNEGAHRIKNIFDSGLFVLATQEWYRTATLAKKVAKNMDLYNIMTKVPSTLYKGSPYNDEKIYKLMNGPIKRKLNLNVTWGAQKDMVRDALQEDFIKPVIHIVEKILNETTIKIQVVTGQLDFIANVPRMMQWVNELQWPNVEQWKKAPRNAFSVNGINEGYQKSFGQLSVYWINRAGHMVPTDNPTAMAAILKILINNET